ncbi:MAG: PIG-L family deacetylase [Firmicutes bacterium]|nr:PIG-L family deacetylase [Bacillota bacterium]
MFERSRMRPRPGWRRTLGWVGLAAGGWVLYQAARPILREFRPANPRIARHLRERYMERARCVVAVTAHPDDLEILCGGTLRRLVLGGARVVAVVASDGEDQNSRANLAHIRHAEQCAAARVLGYHDVRFLGFPGRELERSEGLDAAVERILEEEAPDLIMAFDATHPAWLLVHPDHIAVGRAVVNAVVRQRGPRAGGQGMPEVLLYGTSDPDVLIDIRDAMQDKVRALVQHRSQLRGPERLYAPLLRMYGRITGFAGGLEYAEKFRRLHLGRPEAGQG